MPTKIKTPADYQVAAARLAARARKDPAFKKKLAQDPIKVLKAQGFNPDFTRELVNEDSYLRERFGEAARAGALDWCITTECCCTSCCLSCWVYTGNGRSVNFGAAEAGVRPSPELEFLIARLMETGHIRGPR
jgi:hypothetical protein